MKTKMDRDEFAKFMAGIILSIDMYNFDVLYDIRRIIEEDQNKRENTNDPQIEVYHLMVRPTGCDLVKENDNCYNTYFERALKVYKLTFCYNLNYLNSDRAYCEVELIGYK